MESFIPKLINRDMEYYNRQVVKSEDWNALWNSVLVALDYNTNVLEAIINTGDNLVKNVAHSVESDHSLLSENSLLFAGRNLSTSLNGSVSDSDSFVSTSKQVKNYVDSIVSELAGAGRTVETVKHATDLAVLENVKNTQQDNRLSNIDNINTTSLLDINTLKGRTTGLDTSVATVVAQGNQHEVVIGDHESRIIDLESGAAPTPAADFMTKAAYAYLGSGSKVTYAYKADNVLVDGVITNPNVFALKSTLEALDGVVFKARGALANAAGASYTFGELKTLLLGAYIVTAAQSAKLNIVSPYNQNGNLRLYPVSNGLSLEYEVQAGTYIGSLLTIFIPGSTPDATLFSTLSWECLEETIRANATNISTLTGNRLVRSDLVAGYDMSLVNGTGNTVTLGYTGPKIVLSTTNPGGTAGRQTLWIDTTVA